jgi:molybdopterin/thiamine biosynthesis adenylyltransferase
MRRTLVVVGLGNIGSQLVGHLARMREVGRIVLVDPSRYDATNVRTQAIMAGEVGRSKARVQGRRLERINPSLAAAAICRPVEAIPLGRLRGDAILACVDGRAARQYLNQAARHLGVPLIDAGVHSDGLLARVSVFRPGAKDACLECTWDQADYDAIDQSYPCLAGPPAIPSTGAPAHLGALAAALQAIECERLLSGCTSSGFTARSAGRQAGAGRETSSLRVDGSYEIVVDAASRRQHVTAFAPNAACRLADHEPWRIERLDRPPEDMTLFRALGLGAMSASGAAAQLSLDGMPFITGLTCLECGRRTPAVGLRSRIAESRRACRSCGGRLEATAEDLHASLALDACPAGAGARSLGSLGFEPDDVFAVRRGARTRFFELASAGNQTARR